MQTAPLTLSLCLLAAGCLADPDDGTSGPWPSDPAHATGSTGAGSTGHGSTSSPWVPCGPDGVTTLPDCLGGVGGSGHEEGPPVVFDVGSWGSGSSSSSGSTSSSSDADSGVLDSTGPA